ncbi:heterokaryon incompatibility protein-domain-containing protein [Immersiella caudata]|uniref:Heterokaryon incompatibility protein-domain-containing protein n=1 Tax=Immersiella caudata TaxID=314043 RepID=A0AA40C3T5_9PEZI|nr:heterokaryon incompatibility protein-domain-containing protein [Immersiella caudata]
MDTSKYQYQPLAADSSSIRVLLLLRGSGETLVGQLVKTQAKGGRPYEALSYVWGDPKKTHVIHLGGGRKLGITSSLYHALKNLRPRSAGDKGRIVWADGVCINQEDDGEKAQQVQMMASIYRSARGVITYVGEPTSGDIDLSGAIGLAKTLIRLARKRKRDGLPVNELMNTESPEQFSLPPFDDKRWDSLREFADGRWCTRMWIVQESLLNKNIHLLWGDRKVDWDIVANLSSEVLQPVCYPVHSGLIDNSKRTEYATSFLQMVTMRSGFRKLKKLGRGMPMLMLLQGCRELDCTDNRDRVFALSSLASDHKPTVDYKKDIRQVYIDTAVGLLSSDPAVLSYSGLRRDIPSLPTWVPDWTVPSAQIPVLQCRHFQACGAFARSLSTLVGVDADAGVLRVRGVVYDRIQHVTPKLQLWLYLARMERAKRAKQEAIRLLELGYYPGNKTRSHLEALWRTLINNTDHVKRDADNSTIHCDAPAHWAQYFEAWVRPDSSVAQSEARAYLMKYSFTGRQEIARTDPAVLTSHQRAANSPAAVHKKGDIPPNASVFKSLRGPLSVPDGQDVPGWQFRDAILRSGNLFRRLCTTAGGYLGMVPDEAREGDVLVFFAGARVPHVLRLVDMARGGPQGTRPTETFVLIGDCYLHGLMHGEAFPRGVPKKWQTLTLI